MSPHSSQSSGEAFTPGPWFSDCHDEVCATLDGGAVVVIALANPMAELNEPTTVANARLIAASPMLLETGWALAVSALQSRRYAEDTDFRNLVDAALDACRLARGEQTLADYERAKATGGSNAR